MSITTNLRKGIVALSVFAMGLMVTPVNAGNVRVFTDANAIPTWATEAIESLMDQDVINGNGDGSFAPMRYLNRAEVSKIIVGATGIGMNTSRKSAFSDVSESDWFYDAVTTMYNQGWINGYPDKSFGPGNEINRVELAKMVVNAFELEKDLTGAPHFEDVSDDDWFYEYVETAYNHGLMRGFADGTFGPTNQVTRAETAKIVYDAQLLVAEPGGAMEGTLELSLSSDTPRGTNIPFNATSVPYATLELTASDDVDVEVSALTVTRLGLGDNDDFDNVWLELDGFKVGNDKSINNDDVVELRFNPPIVVPAGQTFVADVVASMDAGKTKGKSYGSQNRLAVVSADDVASTAENVVGDFPLEGEEMEISNYEVTQIGFASRGSDTRVDVGDSFVEIGKFELQNESSRNKDAECRAITFKNDGQAQLAEIGENYGLYVSGEQVSAESIVDGDYVTFRLDNGVTGGYVIEDGDTRVFSVRADIVSAEDGDAINFKVDNFEDIVCVEIGTSFGAKAVSNNDNMRTFAGTTTRTVTEAGKETASCEGEDAEDGCARLMAYEIDSGDLNVARDASSLGDQQYAPGSNDVVVLTARLVVDQPLIVDGVKLRVATGTEIMKESFVNSQSVQFATTNIEDLNAQFDNFRLFLNGKLLDSENEFEGANIDGAYLDFDTTFEIAGTSVLKLVANVDSDARTDTKLKMSLEAKDFRSPEYISTGDQVSPDELLGSARGSVIEVTSSKLTITRSGSGSEQTAVAGVTDVEFLEFVINNNDSGDVDVTSITISADNEVVSGNARHYEYFQVGMFVDGLAQGSTRQLSKEGEATFNDLNVIIPSSGQKEFTLVADVLESAAQSVSGTDQNPNRGNPLDSNKMSTIRLEPADIGKFKEGDIIVLKEGNKKEEMAVGRISADAGGPVDGPKVNVFFVRQDPSSPPSFTTQIFTPSVFTYHLKHKLRFDVVEVDADNVENGTKVAVMNGAEEVADTETARLTGTPYVLVDAGALTVRSARSSVAEKIIVAGSRDVEVMRIHFDADDAAVEVTDIYLVNDFDEDVESNPNAEEQRVGNNVKFKLYNEAGDLIKKEIMTGGRLHFDLGSRHRIGVPKASQGTYVSIRVDVDDIEQASETGAQLQLALDSHADRTAKTNGGIRAVTSGIGADIAVPATGWGATKPVGTASAVKAKNDYLVTKTKLTVEHAESNSNLILSEGGSEQGIYRFQVTADPAGGASLDRISFDIGTTGIAYGVSVAGSSVPASVPVPTTTTRTKEQGKIDDIMNLLGVAQPELSTSFDAIELDFTEVSRLPMSNPSEQIERTNRVTAFNELIDSFAGLTTAMVDDLKKALQSIKIVEASLAPDHYLLSSISPRKTQYEGFITTTQSDIAGFQSRNYNDLQASLDIVRRIKGNLDYVLDSNGGILRSTVNLIERIITENGDNKADVEIPLNNNVPPVSPVPNVPNVPVNTNLDPENLVLVEYTDTKFRNARNGQKAGTFEVSNSKSGQLIGYSFDFAQSEDISAGETKYYELRLKGRKLAFTGDYYSFAVRILGGDVANHVPTKADCVGDQVDYCFFIWSDKTGNRNRGPFFSGYGLTLPSTPAGASKD